MTAPRLFLACFLACSFASVALPANAREGASKLPGISHDPGLRLYSTSSLQHLAARETAGPDTFALFGGPDAGLEGKFETAGGDPDLQGWETVDLTDKEVYWQRSTFNAENLNGNGPGNYAMWCGQDEVQQPSWATAPGYGNDWAQELRWSSPPLADPGQGQTVVLDFYFNADLEAGFDFFEVMFERGGIWETAYTFDSGFVQNQHYGSLGPGVALPIEFQPNTYGGPNNDQIQISLRVVTDGGWSDEDGEFDSNGAVQLDDVSITWSGGVEFEDFEGPGPYLFEPYKQPFFGDWASVITLLTDPDPCRSNISPAVGFIDYGQAPINGPGTTGIVSTGGSTSANINYGVPGHFVVNTTGGLTGLPDFLEINNRIVSPEIEWDLLGSADDGAEMVGAMLCFDVWFHLPNSSLLGAAWEVRSRTTGGDWNPWRHRGVIYLGDEPQWRTLRFPVGDLLISEGIPDVVQFRLGVYDLSFLSGYYQVNSSTPAPVFDNVALLKYRVGGPALSTEALHLANDGFPPQEVFDVSTSTARDALDIPFDMARDPGNRWGPAIVSGDSVVVDAVAVIPGTSVTDVRLVWALQKNPFFEDGLRSVPARPQDENVSAGAQLWTGEVVAAETYASDGYHYVDRWNVDLPDVDFLYPGDVLHYYFQATDSQGRTTTLPANTAGFLDFTEYSVYDRDFMVRGLPSVRDTSGGQPSTLVIYDAAPGQESEFILAFRELGGVEGTDFDTYKVTGAEAFVSNGIGSHGGHGASVDYVQGYENILYLSGSAWAPLSDGTDSGLNSKSDDLSLITAWSALPGPRRIAYFGDSLVDGLEFSTEGRAFMAAQLGVEWFGNDVRDAIGGQYSPQVVPATEPFSTEFVAAGGCFSIADFDHIGPTGTGYVGWSFLDASEAPIPGIAAGVVNDRPNGFDATFPIAFHRVRDNPGRRILPNARASLLLELFDLYAYCAALPCTGTTPARIGVTLSARPNPFNPSTTVQFTAVAGSRGSVMVYNLRGELIRTLHNGEFTTQEFGWDGTDRSGAPVGSGVYLIRATDGKTTLTEKVALVK